MFNKDITHPRMRREIRNPRASRFQALWGCKLLITVSVSGRVARLPARVQERREPTWQHRATSHTFPRLPFRLDVLAHTGGMYESSLHCNHMFTVRSSGAHSQVRPTWKSRKSQIGRSCCSKRRCSATCNCLQAEGSFPIAPGRDAKSLRRHPQGQARLGHHGERGLCPHPKLDNL